MTRTLKIAVAVALLVATRPASAQGPAVAERLPSGDYRIAVSDGSGNEVVSSTGLGSVVFLPVSWTTPSESWSPRTDIPQPTENKEGFERLVLVDGSRIYRILHSAGTSILRVHDAGVTILGTVPGDGLTSGFGPYVAARGQGASLAFATIETPTEPARVFIAPAYATTGPAITDVSPSGGVPGLHPTSLALAQDALFFTDASTLWRHDVPSGTTSPVALPMTGTWVDHEMAVSGDGTTIGLRAGTSATSNRMFTVSADGTLVVGFGTEGNNLPVSYHNPKLRPGYSLSFDGTLLPHFQRTPALIRSYVAENYALYRDHLLGQMNVNALIGVESEIALGDDPIGAGQGGITLFLPIPQFGNMVAALPYPFLQLALTTNMYGNGLFQSLSQFTGASPYPPGLAPDIEVSGHFASSVHGDRFFVVGPQGADRDIVRVTGTAPFGEIVASGIGLVYETAQVGSWMFVRADTTSIPGQSIGLFVVDMSNGITFDSSLFPGGSVTGLTASRDFANIAWTRESTSPDLVDLWTYSTVTGTGMYVPSIDADAGIEWNAFNEVVYRENQALIRLGAAGTPTVLGTSMLPFSIL